LKIVGFSGSVVIDYPHSAKAKKIYLVLELGGAERTTFELIEGLKDE
jgi:18S rRNA (guanine1575-N7)-methyltransferase